MRALVLHSLAPLRNPRLIALHLVLNALLLIAASLWLLIPEAHIWQLIFAGVSALVILFAFIWLHAGTLVYATEPAPEKFRAAFSIKVGRLLWFLVGGFVLFWCMRVVDGWADSTWQTAGYLYSSAPNWLRPTAGSSSYESALEYIFAILFWYLLPCIFLPLIGARVVGASSIRVLRTWGRWQYWLGMAITAIAGVWLTRLILSWTSGHTLAQETVSLVLRLSVAYALATAAWLATTGLLGYSIGPPDENDVGLLAFLWKPFVTPGSAANSIVRHSFKVLRDWRVLGLQFAGAVVLTATADVSSLGEKTWQIVFGIAGGLLLLVLFLWLQAGTLAYAADPDPAHFRAAFAFKIRRISWALLGLVILLVLMAGSEVVLRLLEPRAPTSWVEYAIDAISYYLIPCLVLPWIMAKAGAGTRLRAGTTAILRWPYWAGMAVLILIFGWLSDQLLSWGLGISSSATGIIRFLVLLVANVPYVIGWLLATGLLGYFVRSAKTGSAPNVFGQAVL